MVLRKTLIERQNDIAEIGRSKMLDYPMASLSATNRASMIKTMSCASECFELGQKETQMLEFCEAGMVFVNN